MSSKRFRTEECSLDQPASFVAMSSSSSSAASSASVFSDSKEDSKEARKTTVVNVKVAHIRPRFATLAEWMKEPNHVYIGRRGVIFVEGKRFPPHDSLWANPFKLSKPKSRPAKLARSGKESSAEADDRDAVIAKYRRYISDKLDSGEISIDLLQQLRGCVLGCWCKPEKCHGDVLVELIELYAPSSSAKEKKLFV